MELVDPQGPRGEIPICLLVFSSGLRLSNYPPKMGSRNITGHSVISLSSLTDINNNEYKFYTFFPEFILNSPDIFPIYLFFLFPLPPSIHFEAQSQRESPKKDNLSIRRVNIYSR